MIIGLSIANFTILHVVISLIGIVAGFVALAGMLASSRRSGWTAVFLVTTLLTSVTGFMFPRGPSFTPAQLFGVISLIVLAATFIALYALKLRGVWRTIYVITGLFALYLNTFVLVVQSFQKIPFLRALAPTQTELPFAASQVVLLVIMLVLGFLAVRKFHREVPLAIERS